MSVLEKIQELCNQTVGCSITSLEKELGFGKSTISKWKDSVPNTDKLLKVADYFGVSLDFLMGRESDKSRIIPKNKNEEELIVLFRETNGVSDSDKEMIVKQFESTIDMYLKAKGIKKE